MNILGADRTIRHPAGWAPIALGAAIYFWCAAEFLLRGRGTPAIFFTRPLAFLIGREPQRLVRASIYRYQVPLRLLAAMPHRPQQLRIQAHQACQKTRVRPVVLARAGADQLHLPRIGHDHFKAQPAQQAAHPRRMGSHFHRHAAAAHPGKPLRQSLPGGRHGAFRRHLAVGSQNTIAAALVSQVHADRNRPFCANCCPLRTLFDGAILLHGRSPLHFECVSIGSLSHPAEAGPLIPSRSQRSGG